jgi:hypothetical protein
MYRLSIALMFLITPLAFAADTPSGHPTVTEADKALHTQANNPLPNKGKVLETLEASGYTYLLVSDAGKETWVAVNHIQVKPEDFVRYSKGSVMRNFHSKALKRTFDEIIFAGNIKVEGSHPTVAQAAEILNIEEAGELPNQGKVISTTPSNAYTYIEVEQEGQISWLAVPRVILADGAMIRYGDGAVMKNFYSKKLGREFTEVIFLGGVQVVK